MKHVAFGRNMTSLPGILPLRVRPVAYLESNAVSDLARLRVKAAEIEGIENVRRDLCSFASKRTIALGQWLFSELAFLDEKEDRQADLQAELSFIRQLQFLEIYRSSGDMMRLEVEGHRRRLQVNPAIVTVLAALDEDEWAELWKAERDTLTESKDEFSAWEAAAEKRIAEHYPDHEDTRAHLSTDWAVDSRALVSTTVLRMMRTRRRWLGLPSDERLWPSPEQLPTLWCNWTFRVTRDILLNTLRQPRKRRPGDFVDWCHFMTAAHADEFVSTDKWQLQIARAAPGPKPEILSLEEWVARLRSE